MMIELASEYVVGDMQPILSGVGSKIRKATMEEGVKAGTKEYERMEQDIQKEIEEQQGEDDPVELKDSLADLDSETPLRDQVIREAQLDAWETYAHPDLGTVGHPDEARDPVFTIEAIKAAFLQNESLADAGVTFKALSELDTDFDFNENQDADSVYSLQYPDDSGFPIEAEEGTLAETIASRHQGIGVTFSPELADQYPSLRFLAPGSPLFSQLTDFLMKEEDQSILVTHAYRNDSTSGLLSKSQKPWIVCGWTKDKQETNLVSLSNKGQVIELAADVEYLQDWAQQFIEIRSV